MSARTFWSTAIFSLVLGGALCLHAALSRLSYADWPSYPFDLSQMTTDQIILAYGIVPRAVVATLAGAMLGLSGAILQQVLRNPVADPSTLGISAGAQLAIVVATLFWPALIDGHRALVALGGAALSALLVFLLGWRRSFEPVTMVVSGLLVGITATSLSAALTLSQGEYLMSLVTWNGGSLNQYGWQTARTLTWQLALAFAAGIVLIRPLVVLGLGEASAKSLGASLFATRFAAAAVAVGLSAFVAAAVGLVAFVGLAAPALARGLGVRKPASIMMLSPLAGALLLWICDGFVQLLADTASETFPTGAATALIGGPLLLWLLPKIKTSAVSGTEASSVPQRHGLPALAVLSVAVLVLTVFALLLGRTPEGWRLIDHAQLSEVIDLRWPRLLSAFGAGGLLALSGVTLQRLTGNPMASPEVLGVSGGAGLGFAATLTILPAASNLNLFVGAGLGSLIVIALVLAFSGSRQFGPDKLLLAGIAISAFGSAVLSALLSIGDQRSWQILAWLSGQGSSATPVTAVLLFLLAIFVLLVAMTFVRWLTIMPLGEAVPQALGLPMRQSRIGMIMVAGLATGAASLLVGPLSFVGLMAPHIAQRAGFMTARDHLIGSFLLGGLLMVLSDLGARTIAFPYELPLGLFAALAGAPYLIWLIGRRS